MGSVLTIGTGEAREETIHDWKTNRDVACQMEHFYPGDKTKDDLITGNLAVRSHVKQRPELLHEKVTATVFSGNMRPRKTELTSAELRA